MEFTRRHGAYVYARAFLCVRVRACVSRQSINVVNLSVFMHKQQTKTRTVL